MPAALRPRRNNTPTVKREEQDLAENQSPDDFNEPVNATPTARSTRRRTQGDAGATPGTGPDNSNIRRADPDASAPNEAPQRRNKQEPEEQEAEPSRAGANADINNKNDNENIANENDGAPPLPEKVSVGARGPTYAVHRRLGKGGFGLVYMGEKHGKGTKTERQVALKFEHKSSKGCSNGAPYEWSMYAQLGGLAGVPAAHHKVKQGDYFVMVMDILGPSLWDLWNDNEQRMSESTVAKIAVDALAILRGVHAQGFVHGDIKPENFLRGKPSTSEENHLHLVDLGLASRWRDESTSSHVEYDQKPDVFRGTVRYASAHAHLGRTASRRDDIESLAYTLVFLLKGRLPWQGYQGENKGFLVCRKKMATSADALCQGDSKCFRDFVDVAINLRFDEEPEYDNLRALFTSLTQPASMEEAGAREEARPTIVTTDQNVPNETNTEMNKNQERQLVQAEDLQYENQRALALAEYEEAGPNTHEQPASVGEKRKAEEVEENVQEAARPRKKVRLGMPTMQWITVYNAHRAMKQRYHYNVSGARIAQHIDKGTEDGLYISCVACSQDLWALIMDAGQELGTQTYELSNTFLPKDWIVDHWEEGYYVTSLAGSTNGQTLVVMSKGTSFTQQSYKVSDSFPYKWISKKWKEGFYVTSIATSGSRWAVVMSRSAGFIDQCVELDFMYPSEGIHRRWDAGYRITCCAATPDQAAFVLYTACETAG